jgi:P27 family predicted phage terminase small subunit
MPQPRTPDALLASNYAAKNPARAAARGFSPLYPPCDPAPPEKLKDNALDYWVYFFPILTGQRVISAADRETLANYCHQLSIIDKLQAAIDKDGAIIDGVHGPVKHPATSALNPAHSTCIAYARELGFTPASRGKTSRGSSSEEDKEKDEFDDI